MLKLLIILWWLPSFQQIQSHWKLNRVTMDRATEAPLILLEASASAKLGVNQFW